MTVATEVESVAQLSDLDDQVIHCISTWQTILYRLGRRQGVRALCGMWITKDAHLIEGPGCVKCLELEGYTRTAIICNTCPIGPR